MIFVFEALAGEKQDITNVQLNEHNIPDTLARFICRSVRRFARV